MFGDALATEFLWQASETESKYFFILFCYSEIQSYYV